MKDNMRRSLIFALFLLLLRGSNGHSGLISSNDNMVKFIDCNIAKMESSPMFTTNDVEIMIGVKEIIVDSSILTKSFVKNLVIRPWVVTIIGKNDAYLSDRKLEYMSNMEQCSLSTIGYIDNDFLGNFMTEFNKMAPDNDDIIETPSSQVSSVISGDNSQLQGAIPIPPPTVQTPPVQPIAAPASTIEATPSLPGMNVPSSVRDNGIAAGSLVPNIEPSFGGTPVSGPGEQRNEFTLPRENTLLPSQLSPIAPPSYPNFQQQSGVVQPSPQMAVQPVPGLSVATASNAIEVAPPLSGISVQSPVRNDGIAAGAFLPGVEPSPSGALTFRPMDQNNALTLPGENSVLSPPSPPIFPSGYPGMQQQAQVANFVQPPPQITEATLSVQPSRDIGIKPNNGFIPTGNSAAFSSQSSSFPSGYFDSRQQMQISKEVQPLRVQQQSAANTVGTIFPSGQTAASVNRNGLNSRIPIRGPLIPGQKLSPEATKKLLSFLASRKPKQISAMQTPLQIPSFKPQQNMAAQVPLQNPPLQPQWSSAVQTPLRTPSPGIKPVQFELDLADRLSKSSDMSRLYCSGEPMKNVAILTLRAIFSSLADLNKQSSATIAQSIATRMLRMPPESICSNYAEILSKLITENLRAYGLLNYVNAAAIVDKIASNLRKSTGYSTLQGTPQRPFVKSGRSEVLSAQMPGISSLLNNPVRYAEMKEGAEYYRKSIKVVLEIINKARNAMASNDADLNALCAILNQISPVFFIPRFETCNEKAIMSHLMHVSEILMVAFDATLSTIF